MKGCHIRHGSFTDPRPGVVTIVPRRSRIYGGEQVGVGRSENHPISVKKSPWNVNLSAPYRKPDCMLPMGVVNVIVISRKLIKNDALPVK